MTKSAAKEIPVIRITPNGQVWMRSERGAMVQVSLTDKEISKLRLSSGAEERVAVLAGIVARIARPN